MATITISGNTYTSYATVATADVFLAPDSNFTTWDVLTDDQKGALLVRATRVLDAQSYITSAATQVLRLAIEDFETICILIANTISSGNTSVSGQSVSEAEQKRVKAGSVEIENYRALYNLEASKYEYQWTPEIYALLKKYLSGASFAFAFSCGTDGVITIDDYSLGY